MHTSTGFIKASITPSSTQHESKIAITLSIAHVQPTVRRRPKHVIEKESWVEQRAQRDDIGGIVNNG
jgi:hypothetical protein